MIAPSASVAPPAFGYEPQARTADQERANLELARRYLAAIEAFAGGEDLAAFFTPDVQQVEFPNRLVRDGARRDLPALLEGAARGRQVLRSQRYEVHAAYATASVVILEVVWVGTLAVAVGALPQDAEMRAHFAVFLEIRDSRIARQRNYDCFDPF